MSPDKLLTSTEVAARLGCTRAYVRQRALDPGDPLTGTKLGRDWLFDREHVDAVVASGVRGRAWYKANADRDKAGAR